TNAYNLRRFCTRSCAARFRGQKPPGRKPRLIPRACTTCGEAFQVTRSHRKRSRCGRCHELDIRQNSLLDRTKGELFGVSRNWQSARSAIQEHARKIFLASSLPLVRPVNASLMVFRQRIAAFSAPQTASASLGSVAVARPPRGAWGTSPCSARARVTSVGNRRRPHHGGTHARRIHGTPTCHHSPTRRPPCQVHLPGPGSLPVLVPQVVAPLPRVRR